MTLSESPKSTGEGNNNTTAKSPIWTLSTATYALILAASILGPVSVFEIVESERADLIKQRKKMQAPDANLDDVDAFNAAASKYNAWISWIPDVFQDERTSAVRLLEKKK